MYSPRSMEMHPWTPYSNSGFRKENKHESSVYTWPQSCPLSIYCLSPMDKSLSFRPLCFRPPSLLSNTQKQVNPCHGPKCVTVIRDSFWVGLWCYSSVLWYPCWIHGYQRWYVICGWNVVASELICAPEIVRVLKFFGELAGKWDDVRFYVTANRLKNFQNLPQLSGFFFYGTKTCVFGSEGMEYCAVILLRSGSTCNVLFLPFCGVMSLSHS
jgi:hypothetical protein